MRQHRQPEIMDDPLLDPAQHALALKGLRTINRISRSARIVWRPIREFMESRQLKILRVLDIATGAGDVPIALCSLAQRAGVSLALAACDRSATAIAEAKKLAAAARVDTEFFVLDALRDPLPSGYDVIVCSLFLHHLDRADAVALLRKMAAAAGRMVLVNDLRRSRGGLILAHAATRLLTSSPVVHVDGPRSVRAAYSIAEAAEMARAAGIQSATVERRFPFRFVLSCRRPE